MFSSVPFLLALWRSFGASVTGNRHEEGIVRSAPNPWPAVQVGNRLSRHVLTTPQACPLAFWAPTRLVMSCQLTQWPTARRSSPSSAR